jgi:hypothetical protein
MNHAARASMRCTPPAPMGGVGTHCMERTTTPMQNPYGPKATNGYGLTSKRTVAHRIQWPNLGATTLCVTGHESATVSPPTHDGPLPPPTKCKRICADIGHKMHRSLIGPHQHGKNVFGLKSPPGSGSQAQNKDDGDWGGRKQESKPLPRSTNEDLEDTLAIQEAIKLSIA